MKKMLVWHTVVYITVTMKVYCIECLLSCIFLYYSQRT